jgi:hypothetical protein
VVTPQDPAGADEIHVPAFADARAARPGWMRALNALGRLAPGVATPSAEAWWKAAIAGEPGAREPEEPALRALEALADSLRRDARLSLLGRISARDDTIRIARTHLRVQRALDEHPQILATALPDPVFIIGLPRTGTTFLHLLLSCDPRNRTLPYWESFDPVPPRTGPDGRPAKVTAMLDQLARIAPHYQAIHPMRADSAEECVALFMNEFRTLQFDIQYRAPHYVDWLLREAPRIAYHGYLRQLRLVHFHRPVGERFVLKDPIHCVHLETVLELFPTAKLVFTHRDPERSLSSICSLYAHTRAIFSDAVDPLALGDEILHGYWPRALEAAQRVRAQLPRGACADVRQPDLARDPLGAVRALYATLGFELDEAASDGMQRFIEHQARGPRHVHRHAAEDFGLSGGAIRERFASYVEAFDL